MFKDDRFSFWEQFQYSAGIILIRTPASILSTVPEILDVFATLMEVWAIPRLKRLNLFVTLMETGVKVILCPRNRVEKRKQSTRLMY